MTLVIYEDLLQRSPEWFAARLGIPTASMVGKLLTPTLKVADNDTSRAATESLVAERVTGVVEQSPMTDDMFRGVLHEPIARERYAEVTETEVTEVGFMRLEGDGWTLGYSPDGLVGDDGLIEVKCPRARGHMNTILRDEVPPQYMAQLQAGLLVSGREWVDYVSFFGGLPLYVKRVYPDPKWFDAITAACIAFERDAAAMLADYENRSAAMPPTERIDYDIQVA